MKHLRILLASNLVENDSLGYWYINDELQLTTDIFDGLQLIINQTAVDIPAYDYVNSGWVQGSGIMRVLPSLRESAYMPWDYDVMFTNDQTDTRPKRLINRVLETN